MIGTVAESRDGVRDPAGSAVERRPQVVTEIGESEVRVVGVERRGSVIFVVRGIVDGIGWNPGLQVDQGFVSPPARHARLEPRRSPPGDQVDESPERRPPFIEVPKPQENLERDLLAQVVLVFPRQAKTLGDAAGEEAGAPAQAPDLVRGKRRAKLLTGTTDSGRGLMGEHGERSVTGAIGTGRLSQRAIGGVEEQGGIIRNK